MNRKEEKERKRKWENQDTADVLYAGVVSAAIKSKDIRDATMCVSRQ